MRLLLVDVNTISNVGAPTEYKTNRSYHFKYINNVSYIIILLLLVGDR